MTLDEAYAKYGEAAWSLPQDGHGGFIAPLTTTSSAPTLAQGDWRAYADQYMGAMAGDVKTALNNINPNFDWSNAIKTAGTKYAALDGGLDPNRTPSTVLMQQAVLAARDANPQMDASYWNSIYNNLDPQRVSQAAEIQEWQSKQGDDGFLGLGDLGTMLALAGSVYGLGSLGGLWGGSAGAASGALEAAALTGSGIGAIGPGAALSSSLAAAGGVGSIIDLPWGVNQQNGGGMDWLTDLLKETGEFGSDAATIEGGFNGALSNAPWWSSLPVQGQNLVQSLTKVPGLSKLFGGGGAASGLGSYSFPFGDVLGGILESYGANKQQGDLMSLMNKSLEYIDPFHNQRPQYQTQFRNLTQNPSNFFADPAVASMMDLADETTSRKLASQGYNMSGNFASEIAKTRTNEMFKNYLPYSDMIGTAAGYKLSPGNVGAATGIGQAAAGAGQQAMGGLGSAFNSAATGQQPSYLDQIFGTQKNQNLAQLFMSGLS